MTATRNMSANTGIVPRVFLSYTRIDGEPFATNLQQRLEAEHIPLWQNPISMEFEMPPGIPESQAHNQEALDALYQQLEHFDRQAPSQPALSTTDVWVVKITRSKEGAAHESTLS